MRVSDLKLLLAFAAVFCAANAWTQPEGVCPCGNLPREPGVLWTGSEPIGVNEIVRLAAPILWFTRDEPLLDEEGVVPQAHPCDDPSDHAIVYYQVTEIANRGDSVTLPPEDDPDFFEKVDSMILKFFFYYPQDFGLGGHVHDLEATEFEIVLEEDSGCYRVRVERVKALAHGNNWYSNILTIETDTMFPLTLFVEEGKHASAPDRNADGQFTRGYDVNERINDAWGVRDVMGSGVLLTSAYNAEMTKSRSYEHRLFPPEAPLSCVVDRRNSRLISDASLGSYRLRPGDRVSKCELAEAQDHLESMMRFHGYGADEEPKQYSELTKGLKDVGRPDRWLSISLRVTDNIGGAFVFRGIDIKQGWILPKFNISDVDTSLGVMFTPSASRFADYYIAGGPHWRYKDTTVKRTLDTEQGRREIEIIIPAEWNLYTEVGVKLRARIKGTFIGARLGVQALGFGSLDDIRLIFEVGAGAW